MPTLPNFSSYGDYSSDNYGAHSLTFTDPQGNQFWFSYKTLVAFRKTGCNLYVHRNDWGTTTGKHLNKIDGGKKKTRLDAKSFAAVLAEMFKE